MNPPIYIGWQAFPEWVAMEPFRLYNLTEDIRDPQTGEVLHAAGSTVSERTLVKHGVPVPAPETKDEALLNRLGLLLEKFEEEENPNG